jgi:porphobilinogen synthase
MTEQFMRGRRLRSTDTLRRMVRETRISKDSLIYPIFVREGANIVEEIPSMEGQYRYTTDRLAQIYDKLLAKGVNKVLFFGLPDKKDGEGSEAWREDGIIQRALRQSAARYPSIYRITDVCLCEYTSHGHCGSISGETVDNDKTLESLARTALSHAEAGADIVAPSDMMDGRVQAIRSALNAAGRTATPVMSYAAKYASAFYSPFRSAARSAPSFGDRKSYQMDWHNKKEAVKEALADIEEGADIVIVKPALSYLDIVSAVAAQITVPLAAYSVSGEYALIKAGAKAGSIDEAAIVCETAAAIFRAGANILITYFAPELASFIDEGRIG